MGDLTQKERSTPSTIVGRDESFCADVVQEDGEAKLLVKSTNIPQPLGNFIFEYAMNGPNSDLNTDGSGTPKEFIINADATKNKVIFSLVFEALDNGIKIDNFLGKNSALSNGLVIEIKSQDQIFQFNPITITQEFDSLFSFGTGRSYELLFASGLDSMVARFGPSSPFILKPVGTYTTDDYIKVTVSDNLNSIAKLRFLAVGQLE